MDSRSPLAVGYDMATRVLAISFELVIPIALGIYTDYKLGTKFVFLLIGCFFGISAMSIGLIKLAKTNKKD